MYITRREKKTTKTETKKASLTSKMELFMEIVNGFELLTTFAKSSTFELYL